MRGIGASVLLGIDPGTLVTGFGVIEKRGTLLRYLAAGAVQTSAKDSMPLRLRTIYERILAVIDEYHPDQCGLETAFYGKNVQSTLKLGHARGVAMLAAVHREIPVAEYSPREVKRAVTGSGAASKQQVLYMVRTILKLDRSFTHLDASDALAIAICHAQHLTNPHRNFSGWKEFVEKNPERVRGGR